MSIWVKTKRYLARELVCRVVLCIIYCFLMPCVADVSGDEVVDFLGQLESKHSNTKTLAVVFEQRKYFSFMNKPLVSQGRMFFADPGCVRFELVSPYRSVLLNDGHGVNRYEYDEKGWREVKFGTGKSVKLVTDQISGWMQGKFLDQDRLFEFSVKTDDP